MCEKTILFLRAGTHVLSRSPGSRDERALRAPLKATPDSKPRPSPATLAPELPLLLPLALCPFSLELLSPSSRPRQLPTLSVSLFLPLSFRFSPISLRILSLSSVSLLVLLHLRTPSFSFYIPFDALFLLIRSYPRDAVVLDVHSISGNFKLSLNDGENWPIANFCGHESEFS